MDFEWHFVESSKTTNISLDAVLQESASIVHNTSAHTTHLSLDLSALTQNIFVERLFYISIKGTTSKWRNVQEYSDRINILRFFFAVFFQAINTFDSNDIRTFYNFTSNQVPRVGACVAETYSDESDDVAIFRVAIVSCSDVIDDGDSLIFQLLDGLTGNL